MKTLQTLGCFLVVAVTACARRGAPDGVFESINAQIDHLDAQGGEHLKAVRAAPTISAARGMEDTHRDHIAGEFEAIRAGIDTLSKCTVRVSVSLDTSGLHAALQDVLAEEDQHRNALATITSLEAAIQSEQRHDEAMLRLVGYLRSQRDDLASRAETADCP